MNGAPGYYGQQQYPQIDRRRSIDAYGLSTASSSMANIGPDSMDIGMVGDGQTLDEIISQNNEEMMRRRTYQPHYRSGSGEDTHIHMRRASMMEFGSSLNNDLADFQFDPNPTMHPILPNHLGNVSSSQKSLDPRKVRSRENLSLDTRFTPIEPTFDNQVSIAPFSPTHIPDPILAMGPGSQYLPQSMDVSMDFDDPVGTDDAPLIMQSHMSRPILYTESPIQQSFPSSFRGPNHDPGGGRSRSGEQTLVEKTSQMRVPDTLQPLSATHARSGALAPGKIVASHVQDVGTMNSPIQKLPRDSSGESQGLFSQTVEVFPPEVVPEAAPGPSPSRFSYSSSGFDMLDVLTRVAARKNPEINIGPVDLSCAFVVCDIAQHDMPIVYCSDVFERLTGYTKYEILGRNCRFLQSPDGKVQAGVKRKYVDDSSVLHIKNKIRRRAEVQLSLINYRKGGQPFMNLLTMIPVRGDGEDFQYYVGFQVDLVEQPGSVSGKNPDGSYAINYQRAQFPRYVAQAPDSSTLQGDIGQTIGRDEVSTVLSTIGTGESELSKRIWDKVLLENTDDVVHVLSLKGLFLYLSPASRKVLEYDASELVGTALSSVCHPSDIVPVTRELKDTSSGASVNVVFRIRRKHSGYTWFESHGCLHTEQGKGRKCIILVGRSRPVYALSRSDLAFGGGIGDNELWAKVSTSGMFLFVSWNARTLLDRTPEDLVGTSLQALMRPDSKKELGRMLELARTGKKVTFKHDLQNRRGQVVHAQSTMYPGDAVEGSKPTFLVAQTRLLKMSRNLINSQRANSITSPRTDQASIGSLTPSTNISGASTNQPPSGTSGTPQSTQSASQDHGIITQPGCGGLMIGNQDEALASEDNIFDELKTTRSTSWQFELRQMERQNRLLAEELQTLLSQRKKRKRSKGKGQMEKDCANCHTRVTPEWRRGPSGNRDLCNSCGLRWAKQNGRISPRKTSDHSETHSSSPIQSSPLESTPKAGVQSSLGHSTSTASLASIKPRLDATMQYVSVAPKVEEDQTHSTMLPT